MDSVLPLGIIAAVRPEGLSILGWRFWLWASQTLARVGEGGWWLCYWYLGSFGLASVFLKVTLSPSPSAPAGPSETGEGRRDER